VITVHVDGGRGDPLDQIMGMGSNKYVYLLRGHIFCGACGGTLQGNYQVRVNRLYYGCQRARGKSGERHGRCNIGYFRGELVEELVLREIDAFVANPGESLDELRDQVRARQGNAVQHEAKAKRLNERLRETEGAKQDVMALVKRRRITVDEADVQLEEIAGEAAEVRRELELLGSQVSHADAMESQLVDTALLLSEIRERWSLWRTTNDRASMKAVVQQLVVEVRMQADGSVDRVYAFGKPSSRAAYSPRPCSANQRLLAQSECMAELRRQAMLLVRWSFA
jgi:hypothetical protein